MIYVGEVRNGLRQFIAEGRRAQCVVTSPPYWGLRDYGMSGQIGLEPTIAEYVATMVDVFRLVRDVLANDGVLWLNLGDSYNGSSGRGGKNSLQADNVGSFTNVIWREDRGLKKKDLCGIPWRVAFALQADGWYLRSDIIWSKLNPMPESVTDRCTKAHEYLFLLAKSERYFYDAQASGYGNGANGTRNRRSVWTIATQPYPEAHFATFPEALVEPCILAGSRVGDTVLDPFMGSGTVARVAQRLGRQWLGCELNPTYAAMIEDRTRQDPLSLELRKNNPDCGSNLIASADDAGSGSQLNLINNKG
jgi:DNA modification methylase